jgi:tRNA A-37 threonylcarbamoyl transferase component Bud32
MPPESHQQNCPRCGVPIHGEHHCVAEHGGRAEHHDTGHDRPETALSHEGGHGHETNHGDHERIEHVREQIHGAGTAHKENLGDFQSSEIVNGQIALSGRDTRLALSEAIKFGKQVEGSKVAISKGYKVAAAYDAQVQGWTTQSKIITLPDGKRLFVLYNYPAGNWRRLADRFMEFLSGDKMRKPKPKDWKSTVESRSNIPTIKDMPDNVVVMPFVESINAYDIFAHKKDIKDFGPFDWAKDISVEERIKLLEPMAVELERIHKAGRTWGEAILPNFILTKDKKPILIDPETVYEQIPVPEQQATDLRNLITSACGSLARGERYSDFKVVIRNILAGYKDKLVLGALKKLCGEPLSAWKNLFFNLFTRYRVGATDLNEFETVMQVIVEVLSEKPKTEAPATHHGGHH